MRGGAAESRIRSDTARRRPLGARQEFSLWNQSLGADFRRRPSIAATREGPKVCRLPAGGGWIRTIGTRKISYRFETDFCRLGDGSGSRTGFISFATGNRWFESSPLQPPRGEEEFVRNDQRPYGVIARTTASIANHMCVAFGQTGVFCRIEASVQGRIAKRQLGGRGRGGFRARRLTTLFCRGPDHLPRGAPMCGIRAQCVWPPLPSCSGSGSPGPGQPTRLFQAYRGSARHRAL